MRKAPLLAAAKPLLACTLLVLSLAGCQTPPNIKALQDKNGSLQQQLDQAQSQINQMQADKELMQQKAKELKRIISVLGEEKSSRVAESTNLRGQVRQFVQTQIDNLKQFLLAADLVDYVGGELVERANVDDKPLLVVDLMDPVPLAGTLTGVSGYFRGTGRVSVKVLRPIKDSLVVVWSSKPITIAERGRQRLKFPVVVGVEKGDILAYYLAKPGMVGYDTGTGDTRYDTDDISVGSSLQRSSLDGKKDKRAYSIGVFGLLNAK